MVPRLIRQRDKRDTVPIIPDGPHQLTDYVMISSIRREVEHYQRSPDGSWTLRLPQRDGEAVLAGGIVLNVHRLYRLVPALG